MAGNLYDYIERIAHVLPEVLNTWRAQSPDGFLHVTESLLGAAIVHLESQANHLRSSREDAITAAAIGFLTRYGIRASSQTNSRGHVDLYIQHSWRPALVVCGEAKIWHGSTYHIGGLAQVLGYCTGRLPFCFVLAYVQKGKIADHVTTLRGELDSKLPEQQQGTTTTHTALQWALITEHLHSSGQRMTALHASVNLAL